MIQSNEPTIDQSDENKYPQGGYAPGNYYCNCSTCNEKFQGDKRSFQCEPCGTKSQAEWDALTPDEQAERVRKNIEIYREFENQQKTMKQSNNALPAESKWKLILHEQVERPYCEITNGPISLCASCGFVGETEEDEDAIFKNVAQVLNDSGIDFHSENALEFKQHIEIMQLQTDVDHWKREHQELQAQAQCMVDALEKCVQFKNRCYAGVYLNVLFNECEQALQQFKDGKGKEPPKEIEYMPILSEDASKFDCPTQFPMHLLSEEQAQSNHGQTLKRLKERGGLSVREILAIVGKKKWSYYANIRWEDAIKMLNDILTNPQK